MQSRTMLGAEETKEGESCGGGNMAEGTVPLGESPVKIPPSVAFSSASPTVLCTPEDGKKFTSNHRHHTSSTLAATLVSSTTSGIINNTKNINNSKAADGGNNNPSPDNTTPEGSPTVSRKLFQAFNSGKPLPSPSSSSSSSSSSTAFASASASANSSRSSSRSNSRNSSRNNSRSSSPTNVTNEVVSPTPSYTTIVKSPSFTGGVGGINLDDIATSVLASASAAMSKATNTIGNASSANAVIAPAKAIATTAAACTSSSINSVPSTPTFDRTNKNKKFGRDDNNIFPADLSPVKAILGGTRPFKSSSLSPVKYRGNANASNANDASAPSPLGTDLLDVSIASLLSNGSIGGADTSQEGQSKHDIDVSAEINALDLAGLSPIAAGAASAAAAMLSFHSGASVTTADAGAGAGAATATSPGSSFASSSAFEGVTADSGYNTANTTSGSIKSQRKILRSLSPTPQNLDDAATIANLRQHVACLEDKITARDATIRNLNEEVLGVRQDLRDVRKELNKTKKERDDARSSSSSSNSNSPPNKPFAERENDMTLSSDVNAAFKRQIQMHLDEIRNRDARINWMSHKIETLEIERAALLDQVKTDDDEDPLDRCASSQPGHISPVKGGRAEETVALRLKLHERDSTIAALKAEIGNMMSKISTARGGRAELLEKEVEIDRLEQQSDSYREKLAEDAATIVGLRRRVKRLIEDAHGRSKKAESSAGAASGSGSGKPRGEPQQQQQPKPPSKRVDFDKMPTSGEEELAGGGLDLSDEILGDISLTFHEPSDEWASSLMEGTTLRSEINAGTTFFASPSEPGPTIFRELEERTRGVDGSPPSSSEEKIKALQNMLNEAKEQDAKMKMHLARLRMEKQETGEDGASEKDKEMTDLQEECHIYALQLINYEAETKKLKLLVEKTEASNAGLMKQLKLLRSKIVAEKNMPKTSIALAVKSEFDSLKKKHDALKAQALILEDELDDKTAELAKARNMMESQKSLIAEQRSKIAKQTLGRLEDLAAMEKEKEHLEIRLKGAEERLDATLETEASYTEQSEMIEDTVLAIATSVTKAKRQVSRWIEDVHCVEPSPVDRSC